MKKLLLALLLGLILSSCSQISADISNIGTLSTEDENKIIAYQDIDLGEEKTTLIIIRSDKDLKSMMEEIKSIFNKDKLK